MKKYPIGGGNESSQVGQEIDVTMKRALQKGLSMQIGASLFFASDDFVPSAIWFGEDPGLWLYAMLTADIE